MMSERRTFPPAPETARALVLTAHPRAESFNTALAAQWAAGARTTGAAVETIDVHSLRFDPALRVAHHGDMPLESDVRRVQAAIAAAAHVTIAFPVWWGSTPALLKGLFDRVFLPGWAYKMGTTLPEKGLRGRTGRLLVTMDTPRWYDRLLYRASARRQVQVATLHFVGIQPTRITAFGGVDKSTAEARARMLRKAYCSGVRDGAALVARYGPVLPA